jgi:hypothetical protein
MPSSPLGLFLRSRARITRVLGASYLTVGVFLGLNLVFDLSSGKATR